MIDHEQKRECISYEVSINRVLMLQRGCATIPPRGRFQVSVRTLCTAYYKDGNVYAVIGMYDYVAVCEYRKLVNRKREQASRTRKATTSSRRKCSASMPPILTINSRLSPPHCIPTSIMWAPVVLSVKNFTPRCQMFSFDMVHSIAWC